ncbi:Rho family guanine nucleotide exchange factor [Saccharomycopsis crataegensis]|uniref:Rho family guanine nucleotide exchange factor n=1 Tax=Saccharomycopsis crataegensis TaxID=43959 RepID=A0AAV5QTL3_9ASCO|nr:Rho family guanine nucleotide exchange factor [Saccharomycopsis crataegensis]
MSKASSKIVQRLDTPSAPVASNALIMNSKGSVEKSLFYICLHLIKRLEKVPGLQQYLRIAYITATTTNEEQACALSQNSQRKISNITISTASTLVNANANANANATDLSSKRKSDDTAFSAALYNFHTFASGMLPANVSCDPVTQVWKLFQQGAPLCVIYNAVNNNSNHQLPIVSADDLNICKRSVYDFFSRCKEDLNFRDDELVPISYVFSSNTNDLIRVIQVVNTVLDMMNPTFSLSDTEKQELFQQQANIATPKDPRYNVLREMVETERKYVQDLEIMLAYKNELRQAELIPAESLHVLFPNLNQIVDMQRRLLVGLEANALAPPKLQRIGSIFLHSFEPFKAYEPWSLGHKAAAEILHQEMLNMERSSTIIRGELELNSFLLKPVQRLCKYPLLLKELVKYTDKTWPHYSELVSALQASKETAAHVNEAQRKVENLVQLRELQERVHDWKGYDINSFGNLLYYSTLGVRDSDAEREFHVYLFEQIILFFKESSPKDKEKKSKKKNSLNDSFLNNRNKLELKGRIYIPNIYNISSNASSNAAGAAAPAVSAPSGHLLTVSWSGSRDSGSFVMRFRNEEARTQWESCLRELVSRLRVEIQEYKTSLNNGYQSGDHPTMRSSMEGRYSQNQYAAQHKLRANSSSYIGNYGGGAAGVNNGSATTINGEMDLRSRSVSSPSLLNNYSKVNNSSSLISPMSNLSISSSIANAESAAMNMSPNECIKIKLSFKQDIFTLLIPRDSDLTELKKRIEKKLKQCGAMITMDTMKIRYQDEEGDYIAIDSNEDWSLAQEVVDDIIESSGDSILSIWVIQT